MALRDALEIQEKQAALRETPLQWLGASAPLLFFGLFFFGSFSSLFRNHPERALAELEFYVFWLFCICVCILFFQRKNRRKIAELEIEILKLKRKLNEESENEK